MSEIKMLYFGGETVIGRVLNEDDTDIEIERPCTLVAMDDPSGKKHVFLTPPAWSYATSDKTYTFEKIKILLIKPVKLDLEKAYLQKTSPIARGVSTNDLSAV